MDNNELDGTMPESICLLQDIKGGFLKELYADIKVPRPSFSLKTNTPTTSTTTEIALAAFAKMKKTTTYF